MHTIMLHRLTSKLKMLAEGKNMSDELDDDEYDEKNGNETDSEFGAFGKDLIMELFEDETEMQKIIYTEGDDEIETPSNSNISAKDNIKNLTESMKLRL